MFCAVLFCNVLYRLVMHRAALCCAVVCCTVLYCVVLRCAVLCCTAQPPRNVSCRAVLQCGLVPGLETLLIEACRGAARHFTVF